MSRWIYLLRDKYNGSVTDVIFSSKSQEEVQAVVDKALKEGEKECEWENIMDAFEKDEEIEVAHNVDGTESIWY